MRFILVAMLLAGCVQTKPIHLPDGRQGHSINCSGQDFSWNHCYEKAGEICQSRGYDIVNRESDQISSVAATQYGALGGTKTSRTLLIACK
jgi:hypothetical protein